jgi:hypothetical protein
LDDLEKKLDDDATLDHAQHLRSKLDSLDAGFKVHHYSVIHLIEDERDVEDQQDIIDQHDDSVAELGVQLQKLVSLCSSYLSILLIPVIFIYGGLNMNSLQSIIMAIISLDMTVAVCSCTKNNC